jgi:RNA polymerase sigma factor (sigma-70 family)
MYDFNQIIAIISPYVKSYLKKKCKKYRLNFNDTYEYFLLILLEELDKTGNFSGFYQVNINNLYHTVMGRLKKYISDNIQYQKHIILSENLDNVKSHDKDFTEEINLKADLEKILTPLEFYIVNMKYNHGLTNTDLAQNLGLSVRTIERYLAQIREKLKDYFA